MLGGFDSVHVRHIEVGEYQTVPHFIKVGVFDELYRLLSVNAHVNSLIDVHSNLVQDIRNGRQAKLFIIYQKYSVLRHLLDFCRTLNNHVLLRQEEGFIVLKWNL